ncbi:MAG: tyrosine--tRNA ligase [Lachnospiraceae bacterium]|nr:tyrosine--tRNA ligase [Lachnospiraceae bacterium]
MKIYEELQARGLIAQVTDEAEIRELINNGGAKFYIGFDPTADSLHVGHFMALCLMKRLQLAGNKPVVLLGGGTGFIGDPSGRTDMRSMMSAETIQHNCDCFLKQIGKFIEFGEDKAIVVNNADWLLDLKYVDLLRDVGAYFSVNNMLRARCYEQRMERGLSFFEFNYMIMQSYDFLYLNEKYGCNMQFGGDDQWSNMLAGTELIRKKTGKDAYAMTITLLLNSEGNKMGKTAKGAVWLDPNKTTPFEFYQYWRNIDDADVMKCIRLLTFIPVEQIEEIDHWDASRINEKKELLAYELTSMIHGKDEADKAKETSLALFAGDGDDSNMPSTTVSEESLSDGQIGILDLLVMGNLTKSKGEARRLIDQGGITLNGEKVTSSDEKVTSEALKDGIKIKKGKKVYHKFVLEDDK